MKAIHSFIHSANITNALAFLMSFLFFYSCQDKETLIVDTNILPPDKNWLSYNSEKIIQGKYYSSTSEIIWFNDSQRLIYTDNYSNYSDIYIYNTSSKYIYSVGASVYFNKNLILSSDNSDLYYLGGINYYSTYDSICKLNKYNISAKTNKVLLTDSVVNFKISKTGNRIAYLSLSKPKYEYWYELYLVDENSLNPELVLENYLYLPEYKMNDDGSEVYCKIQNNNYYKFTSSNNQLTKISQSEGGRYFKDTSIILPKVSCSVTGGGTDKDGNSIWNLAVKDSNNKSIFSTVIPTYLASKQCSTSTNIFKNERRIVLFCQFDNPSYQGSYYYQLLLIDLDKKKIADISPNTNNPKSISVSPDGTKIVYFNQTDYAFYLIDWAKVFK